MRISIVFAAAFGAVVACSALPARHLGIVRSAQDSLSTDSLLLRGRTEVRGASHDTLLLAVELVNRGRTSLALEYGACALEPRLIRPGASAARPAYAFFSRPDSSMVRLRDGRLIAIHFGCPLYLAMATVAPGGAFSPAELHFRAGIDSIAADSLHGVFGVVARVHLLGRYYDVPAGTLQLP